MSFYKLILLVLLAFCLPVLAAAQVDESTKFMVAMDDSVSLATFIHKASTDDSTAYPTLLIRTKENITHYNTICARLNEAEYNVIVQQVRGNGESEGKETFFLSDLVDGQETIDWIAAQTWSDSAIGLIGFGMDGYLANMLASSGHKYIKAAYTFAAPLDFYQDVAFPNGTFRQNFIETWLAEINSYFLRNAFDFRPHYTSFWHPLSVSRKVSSISIPIKHIGGWFQPFLDGTVNAFSETAQKGLFPGKTYQNLTIGPWAYSTASIARDSIGVLQLAENSKIDLAKDIVSWFDLWMKYARPDSLSLTDIATSKKVRYYLMSSEANVEGANEWYFSESWPPQTSKPKRYFLSKNGSLITGKPDEKGNAEALRYDPVFPMPTRGGTSAFLPAGPVKENDLELRKDALIFTTERLLDDVQVIGQIRALIFAASTAEDTDFFVRIADVSPDGQSILVSDGHIRARHRNTSTSSELLTPKKVESFSINIGHMAYIFPKGHRIRVMITSSSSPQFEANPNSPLPFGKQRKNQVALNYIYYGGKRASFIELPISVQKN